MAEIDGTIVKRTQETLGKYVKRPPLTEKLLLRPPFRFLHDIVTMVIKDTGFLEGLYTEDELNSDNVKERDAKILFLDKLISVVNNVTNQNLTVRSAKVVAGLEADKTNELLQAIGDALDRKLDSKNAVATVLGGNIQKPAKAIEKSVVKKENSTKKDSTATKSKKIPNGTPGKEEKAKPKPVGATNGKAPIKKVSDVTISKTKEKEKTVTKEKTTKLGPVKQPVANKPNASKITHAAKKEAKPTKPKDKETSSQPKIVEEPTPLPKEMIKNGLVEQPPTEPVQINTFENLALGEHVVEEKLNNIETLLSAHQPAEIIATNLEMEFEPKVETSKLESPRRSGTKDELSAIIDEEAEMRKKERNSKRSSSKHRFPPDNDNQKEETAVEMKLEEKTSTIPPISQQEDEKLRPAAHQSAKDKKEKVEQTTPRRENTRTSRQSSMEATQKERPSYVRQPTEIDKTAIRPRTSLRPPSVRPASARPAAPTRRRDKNIEIVLQPEEQVKLGAINVKMESFNTELEDDGENLVVIEDPSIMQDNLTQDSGIFSGSGLDINGEVTAQQQGHLVQQILETQTQFSTSNDQRKIEMEWDTGGQKLTYTKQMESIRDSIQKITRSVNPLGKLMDFLQEDIDSMQRELEMWQDRYNQANLELQKEKEFTLSAMDPLRHQLAQIGDNIKEHKEIIDVSRASILQNDQKIFKLLTEM